MFRNLTLWLAILVFGTSLGLCEDVAYEFGEDGYSPLGHSNLTEYNGTEVIVFTVASGSDGRGPTSESVRTVDSIKQEIDECVNVGDPDVNDLAVQLAAEHSGDRRIDQISSIYDHLRADWRYVSDPRDPEDYYRSAVRTIKIANEIGCSGAGDCDDFAILMSSLIENIGVSTRIILAYGQSGGHAYTEVYLGKMDAEDSRVNRTVRWLRAEYDEEPVHVHIDRNQEVWLNLDWWGEHPGGPIYDAEKHVPIYVRDNGPRVPAEPLNEPPLAIISYEPEEPSVGDVITFNASQSRDPYGSITSYVWDFGDGAIEEGCSVEHSYKEGGVFIVNLTVTDDEGAEDLNSSEIKVNKPPIANFSYSLQKFGEVTLITFNASKSIDEDGRIENYEWDFGDGETAKRSSRECATHFYQAYGNFTVNLTVTDDKGAKSTKSIPIKINEPPVPGFSYDPNYPNAGDNITFDASQSKDNDGNIVEYRWDFGDGNTAKGFSVAHNYSTYGKFTVELEIRDSDDATSKTSREVEVNALPVARFTYEPNSPKLDEKVKFDASQSSDDDGSIAKYEWDFGDGYHINTSQLTAHSYLLNGSYTITLTVTDDKGATSSNISRVIIGPCITSHRNGDKVARITTLIGECPDEVDDDIWIFVANKPPLIDKILYYPQSMNASIGEITPKINGKWEMMVGLGSIDPNHVGKPFDIVLTVADARASQDISDYLIRCHKNNDTYIGLESLPKGVTVVEKIEVVRTEEDIGLPPNVSNVQLEGQASINVQNGASVNESMVISGKYTPDVEDRIWVLVRPSWGRWFPQSTDPCSERYEGHINMTGGKWSVKCQFGDNKTRKGEPFDVITVLADENACDFFTDFQSKCCKNNKSYPGLLTIELPQGFEVKNQTRVYRVSDVLDPMVVDKWNRTFGGSGDDMGRSVQQTMDDGYIMTGWTESYGSGGQDIWLIKTDSSGNEVWNRTFGGSDDDAGSSVQEISSGDYIITGQTTSYSVGGSDCWLIKTDSYGNKIWERTFGGTDNDVGESVQEIGDGDYIMIGWTESYGAGGCDAWLIKTDSSGNETWNRTFGGSGDDKGYSAQETCDGGYIIIGRSKENPIRWNTWLMKTDSEGDIEWNKTLSNQLGYICSVKETRDNGYVITGNKIPSPLSASYYLWLAKIDSDGRIAWDKIFGRSRNNERYLINDIGNSVQVTADNGYIIAGRCGRSLTGMSPITGDAWLIKTDSSGNEVWNRTFGGSCHDEGYSVHQTKDGGYIITGQTKSYGAGNGDVWLIKTDSFGSG